MLGDVIHDLANGQSPWEIARRLDRDYGGERCPDWSALFKLLLQLHLDPLNHERYEVEFRRVEESLLSLRDIYREIEMAEREDDANYPGEDVNYYILLPLNEVESPIYVFIKTLFLKHGNNAEW
jgi:hypothetical protein